MVQCVYGMTVAVLVRLWKRLMRRAPTPGRGQQGGVLYVVTNGDEDVARAEALGGSAAYAQGMLC